MPKWSASHVGGPRRFAGDDPVTTLAKKVWIWLAAAIALGLTLHATPAFAQKGAGVLTGVVIDTSSKKPLADVVVTATSPALQGEEVMVTDDAGFYRIPNLPSGVYTLRLEKEAFKPFSRGPIELRADATLRVNAELLPDALQAEEVVVEARPPTVDIGSSSISTSLTSDFARRVPNSSPTGSANRSFEGIAEAAPGTQSDDQGVSISGASSPENRYLVDGVSIGNPGSGVVGTPLSTEFVKEASVISAGYMPEYGRSTGGVMNVVTKTGSNEWHGSAFAFLTPGALQGTPKRVQGAAQAYEWQTDLSMIGDVGFQVGGPIVKDKLWFFAGFDVATTRYNITRRINKRAFSYQPKVGDGTDGALGGYTDANGNPIEAVPTSDWALLDEQKYKAAATTYQGIGKLTYAVDQNNRLSVTFIASPTRSGENGQFSLIGNSPEIASGASGGEIGSLSHLTGKDVYDASAKWTSEFLNKRLLWDVTLGLHSQKDYIHAADGSTPSDVTNPNVLA